MGLVPVQGHKGVQLVDQKVIPFGDLRQVDRIVDHVFEEEVFDMVQLARD
jgi:hypothetical protein